MTDIMEDDNFIENLNNEVKKGDYIVLIVKHKIAYIIELLYLIYGTRTISSIFIVKDSYSGKPDYYYYSIRLEQW